jgi:sRNA-binding protein
LAERFPALFTPNHPLPIKLRIQADIQLRAPGLFNKKSLSIFLHRHTTSTAYIRALLAASNRFDLDGQAAGEITEEHRSAATTEMERRKAIVQARRQAEREASRPARAAATGGNAGPESGQEPGQLPAPAEKRPRRGKAQAPKPRQERQRLDPQTRHTGQRPDSAGSAHTQRPQAPGERHASPARGAHTSQGNQPPSNTHADTNQHAAPPRAPRTPEEAAEDQARRDRLALLRTFESSTLTKANFLVLKRMSEAELDAQLALARQDRQR